MNKYFLRLFAALFALIITASCTDYGEEMRDIETDETDFTGTPIEAGLLLRVNDERAADGSVIPITRAPLDIDEDNLYNVWVFQFNGEGDDATLVCPPYYIDDEAMADAVVNEAGVLPMPLIDSKGVKHRLVFIANINDRNFSWNLQIGQGTYGELKSRYLNLSNESPTYGADRKNLVMSGSAVTPVSPFILVDGDTDYDGDDGSGVAMTRSAACIELNLKVSAEGFKVVSVQLRSVSRRLDYFDALLEIPDNRIHPVTVTTLDYAAEVDMNGLVNVGETEKSFRWFVPRNARGTSPASISPLTKNAHAFKGSTFFEILAEDSNGKGVIYRIYPGANDENDFNVIPNHKYTITLNITGAGGDDALDSRIEKYSDVKFKSGSNCYMLNPPPQGFGAREFQIPVSQINRYWHHAYDGYGGLNHNALESNDNWIADLLWQDAAGIVRDENDVTYDESRHISISKNTGTGGEDHFTVKVPANATHGNFVVVVRRVDSGGNVVQDILWSWHLWVTNYNPDPRFVAISGDKFIYPVTGGNVDRYFGTRFGYSKASSADYASSTYSGSKANPANSLARSVVMDRNLGSLNLNYLGSGGRGNIYYQYGRKDPFPGNVPLYDIKGTVLAVDQATAPANFPEQYWTSGTANYTGVSSLNGNNQIVHSIQNPMRYLGAWQGTNNVSYAWNDSQSTDKVNYTVKSIYDPCPEGWRLMPSDAMDDFRVGSDNSPTMDETARNLPYFQNDAHRYYPYIMENGVDYSAADCILFFSHAQRNATGGGFNSNMGTSCYIWFASSTNTNSAQCKNIAPSGPSTSNSTSRSMGNSVRCVSE